nr:RICIN domain-containing protein [Actinomadura graeca]
MLSLAAVPASAAGPPDNLIFRSKNLQYGQCMDLANGDTADGTPIGKYDCVPGTNRRWYFETVGVKCRQGTECRVTYRVHTAVAPNKCVDIKNRHVETGETINERSCDASADSQLWYLIDNTDGSTKFASFLAFRKDPGAQYAIDAGPQYGLRIWPANDSSNAQHWSFIPQ